MHINKFMKIILFNVQSNATPNPPISVLSIEFMYPGGKNYQALEPLTRVSVNWNEWNVSANWRDTVFVPFLSTSKSYRIMFCYITLTNTECFEASESLEYLINTPQLTQLVTEEYLWERMHVFCQD